MTTYLFIVEDDTHYIHRHTITADSMQMALITLGQLSAFIRIIRFDMREEGWAGKSNDEIFNVMIYV